MPPVRIAISSSIVMKAIEEPVRQIAKNAGYDGSVIVNSILRSKEDLSEGVFLSLESAAL